MRTPITSPDGTPASKLAFGAMQFGGRADKAASSAMFHACVEAGITHFDTAHLYNDGASETLLGQLAAPIREHLVIATKAGYSGGAGTENMLAQFDLSRQRLNMDMVDILYLHQFDPDTDISETLAAFATLQQRGQIRYVGLSNFAAWQVMKAQCVAQDFDLKIDILQPMYNLVKRQAEVEILPMCVDQDSAVAPYSPLGGGLLSGKYGAGGSGRLTEDDRYAARYSPDYMHRAAQRLTDLAHEIETHPATLAVACAAAHPSAPTPIISGRAPDQIAPSLAALDYPMTPALYDRISALSPTPPPATDRLEETNL